MIWPAVLIAIAIGIILGVGHCWEDYKHSEWLHEKSDTATKEETT